MLTKSTPVVMTTAALIIVCSLVPGLLEGGWERDEGDGAVRLEPGKPPSPAPLLCPCSPPGAPVSCLLMSLGPLAPALRPRVWRPSPQCLDLPLARGSPGGMGSRCRAGAVQSPFAPGEGEALVAHQVVRQLGHGPGHVSQPRARPLRRPTPREVAVGSADPPLAPSPFPTPPLTPRTQMTSWWPRPSVRAMTRTWRSASPVLVSAFPPSPAPGPTATLTGGGDWPCHLAQAQEACRQALAFPDSSSPCPPFPQPPGPTNALW